MLIFNEVLNDVPVPLTNADEDMIQDIQNAKEIKLTVGHQILAIIENATIVEEDGEQVIRAGTMKLVDGEPHKLSLEEKLVFLNNMTQSNYLDLKDLCSTKNMGYSINEPEYDMQKFSGRFKSFLNVCNPLHAFYSDRRIKEFQLLIKVQKRDEEKYFKMTGTRKMIVSKEKV